MNQTVRALAILSVGGGNGYEMTAFEFGAKMWPERTGRVASASGGGDYAAQMLLGRLRKAGYVIGVYGDRCQDCGLTDATRWRITEAGRAHLQRWLTSDEDD